MYTGGVDCRSDDHHRRNAVRDGGWGGRARAERRVLQRGGTRDTASPPVMAIYSGQRRLRLGGTGIAVLAWCSAACGSAGAKNVSEAGEAGVGAESGTDVGDTSTSDVPSSDTAEEDGEL